MLGLTLNCIVGKFFEYLEASKTLQRSYTQFTLTLFKRVFFKHKIKLSWLSYTVTVLKSIQRAVLHDPWILSRLPFLHIQIRFGVFIFLIQTILFIYTQMKMKKIWGILWPTIIIIFFTDVSISPRLCAQNLRPFWRTTPNLFILALLSSLYIQSRYFLKCCGYIFTLVRRTLGQV